ncbi:hypothetical protein INP57_21365 [Saccharopolyspora sp. HNM0986]|nr:hypothetical protein [Saccharopolyspora sp. HNM0986]
MSRMPGSVLRRIAQQANSRPAVRDDSAPRCELCADALDERHRHLLDTGSGAVSCACPSCGVLFDHGNGGGQRRLIRSRPRRLGDFVLDDLAWIALGVPVGLAFFVRDGASGAVTAFYPNPIGTMRTDVDPECWKTVTASNPPLSDMDDDVEALLIDRLRQPAEYWLLPLDECHRLTAVLRTHWRGFGGGPEVWEHVDRFFARLR